MLLAFGICLRASRGQIEVRANSVDRGDLLLERLIATAAPGLELPRGSATEAYIDPYQDLYRCLQEEPAEQSLTVQHFVEVWYAEKMAGFTLKDMHLEPDPRH